MKKNKAKLASKKTKAALEDKLITAFTTIVADYGKVKKAKAIIEKFAKQLSKKVDLKASTAIIAEEVAAPVKEKAVKAKPVKKVAETAE